MVRKSFWVGSILINIFGIIYINWWYNQSFNGVFGGLIESLFLLFCLYVFSFVHLFFAKTFKIKLVIGFIDLLPLIIYSLMQDRSGPLYELFLFLFLFYLAPAFIISILNLGIQKLWRKIRK